MKLEKLESIVQSIVLECNRLRKAHDAEEKSVAGYVAIFSQSEKEFKELLKVTKTLGRIIEETPPGPVFLIQPMETASGKLRILKIRKPDAAKPQRGDTDYSLQDYPSFKQKHLKRSGFRLIQREKFEMIELMDNRFNAIAYFSNPPVEKQLGLT